MPAEPKNSLSKRKTDHWRPKKVVLFLEIGRMKIFLSLTRLHIWICIRIYIFNFNNNEQTVKKQEPRKTKETKEEKKIANENLLKRKICHPGENFSRNPHIFRKTGIIFFGLTLFFAITCQKKVTSRITWRTYYNYDKCL